MEQKKKDNTILKNKKVIVGFSVVIAAVIIIIVSNMTFHNEGKAQSPFQNYNKEYVNTLRDTKLSIDGNGELLITRNRVEENNDDLEDAWTVLVYMTGSDLESDNYASTKIMNDMAKADINTDNIKKLNLLVQTGGAKRWGSNYGSTQNLHRLKLSENGEFTEVEKLPIASMGNPDTLADFINWGMSNYPAKKTMVIFWDHGGPLNDLCYDELYDDDALTINEVEYAFAKSKSALKAPVDVALFHTCSNGTIEYANALAPYINYMIITPTYTPTYGFNYKSLMNQMLNTNQEDTTPEDICHNIIKEFGNFVDGKPVESVGNYALMTYDLRKLDAFLIEFNKICKKVYELSNIDKKSVKKLYKSISKTSQYNLETNFDVNCYLDTLEARHDIDVSKCQQLLDDVVVRHVICSYINSTCVGMAMYHPTGDMTIQEMNLYRNKAVSPYYMMYLERLAHYMGDRDFDTFKNYNWTTSNYFYEENFEFLNYAKQRYNNKIENEDMYNLLKENTNYASDGFVDSWKENIEEIPFEERRTYTDIEIAATEDTYTATITGEKDAVNSVFNTVYATINDSLVCLGENADATYDEETGRIKSNFKGEWLMLSDGQLLTTYYNTTVKNYDKEASSKEYVEYCIPVVINDKESLIYVLQNKEDFIVRYVVAEKKDGINSGYAQELTTGMKFTPIYDVWDEQSQSYVSEYGEEYTYKGDKDFLYTTLADDEYYYAFVIEDVTRNKMYSEEQKFSVAGSEVTLTVE